MNEPHITTARPRIVAIDILKVMAVFVVLNSHMELCYGEGWKFLATGGAFGDALFFFCSGFMLFRGQRLRFDNFMKRRISRIYPTVIIVAIVGALLFGRNDNIVDILLWGGGWFVTCIMMYYVVLWAIHRWMMNYMWAVWLAVGAVVLTWFYLAFDHGGTLSMYGANYFKWSFFFVFMLQGAVIGVDPGRYRYSRWALPKMLGCMALWYGCFFAVGKFPMLVNFQYISILPLGGVTYYAYLFCCAPFWARLYSHRTVGRILFIVGGLCLECYLIQGYLFTDSLNWLFPLNIPLIMIGVLLVSYAINFLSTALRQTFLKEDYDWRSCLLDKK